MRLIEADLLTTEMIKIPGVIPSFNEDMAFCVVRCRDCKHMYRDNVGMFCKVWNGYNGCGYDGFCNYGERKEVVDDGQSKTV